MKKTILLVAMSESIHTCHWVEQLTEEGWDIHLFPSTRGALLHPGISSVRFHHPLYGYLSGRNVRWFGRFTRRISKCLDIFNALVTEQIWPNWQAMRLARLIKRLRPDLIHSMEIQAGGYLTLEAKRLLSGQLPPWLVTNWGSDIYLFGRIGNHKAKIREVLANCEYYSCECERDIGLARQFGFKGRSMEVFPNAGGFALDRLESVRDAVVPSARRVIMLKGYQGWAGRALFGLRALEQCADILKDYEVAVYSADSAVVLAAELFASQTGIAVHVIPDGTPHEEMLVWHGKARISIGLSIGDAISTSLLEALVMGSFPIQSCTACATEWLTAGVSGSIVPPEDIGRIEQAIRNALTDDDLVDQAANINWQVARARLDRAYVKSKVVAMYADLLNVNPKDTKTSSYRYV